MLNNQRRIDLINKREEISRNQLEKEIEKMNKPTQSKL